MIAYIDNEEFNNIFRKYHITQEEYTSIINNNLLFDMTAILKFSVTINTTLLRRFINFYKKRRGEQRTNEIFMKKTLEALFNQKGLIGCINICNNLLFEKHIEVIEKSSCYDCVYIEKVRSLLINRLNNGRKI